MWRSLAKASILVNVSFGHGVFGFPYPTRNACASYGPWTKRVRGQPQKRRSLTSSDSRHTLKVNPEQSPPSPPVLGSLVGSFGESSTLLSFQQPPPHW